MALLKHPKHKKMAKHFLGFGSVGLFMTVLGNVFLYVLLEMLNWNVYLAYPFIYLINIFIAYYLNGKFVFKQSFNWKHLGGFYIAYTSGMLIGLLVLTLFKVLLPYNDFILSVLTLPFTITWNFTFVNLIFNKLKAPVKVVANA
jgi:putative flippase GtrA